VDDPTIKYGILKCRDLVQLYYGARMVAVPKEQLIFLSTLDLAVAVLGQDPRRISYEIVVTGGAGASGLFYVGTKTEMDTNAAAVYRFVANVSTTIKRDFFTQLDAVCLPLFVRAGIVPIEVFVREIILTPSPIDEGP
jgi:hypothetical protein